MSHKTAISLIGAAVVACTAYGAYFLLKSGSNQSTDDAYITADSVLVAPRLSGQISRVVVSDNQPVKAGQLLAQIDDGDFLVAQAAELANVNAAQAELKNLAASIQRQASVIDQAAATTRSTAASLKFASVNAQRYQNLSNAGAGTQQERQRAEAELQNWQAVLDRDNAALVASNRSLDVLKARHEVAQAALARAEAALRQANLNMSYTHIVAPQDGMIGQRSVRVGAYVSPGNPLMAVVPLHDAYVVANFRETQLEHMRPRQPVKIHVDSFPDQVFKGHLDSVAPATGLSFSAIAPDNATGNFTKVVQRIPVKIILDANQPNLDALRVGMSVIATVDIVQEG